MLLEDPEQPLALQELWCLVAWAQRTPELVPLLDGRAPEVRSWSSSGELLSSDT